VTDPAQPPPAQPPTGGAPPDQPHLGQPHPGAAQHAPGQPLGGEPYPGQPYPGAGGPGQPYPGAGGPGQPYPGQPYPGQPYPGSGGPGAGGPGQPPSGGSGMGVAALVVGIGALLTSVIVFVGMPLALVAIGLGIAGRARKGKGMAIAGIVLGVLALLAGFGTLVPQDDADDAGDVVEDADDEDADDEDAQGAADATVDPSELAASEAMAQASEFSSSIGELSIGDCFTSFTVGETVFSLTEVSCSAEHEGEVVGAFTVEGMTTEEELVAEAESRCPTLLQEHLGAEAATFDGQLGYLFQTTGDPREIRCYSAEAAS
jgi:hypothetical protein